MPNRILKESICKSDDINSLSWFEEVLFYRLIVNCDDYGRFDGRPKIIKSALFPLKEAVRTDTIERALQSLSTAGIVLLYEVDGKPYLQLTAWSTHQRVRNSKEKYPAPNDAAIAAAPRRKLPQPAAISRKPRPESESESESLSVEAYASCPEPGESPASGPVALMLSDGSEWTASDSLLAEYARLYPGVDVGQQFRCMRAWCISNPEKRKTRRGITRFVNNWLAREQDSYKPRPETGAAPKSRNRFLNIEPVDVDYDALAREKARRRLEGGAG